MSMDRFLIIATERFGGRGYPVCEYTGKMEAAINEAIRVFHLGTMHKVIVIDCRFAIVFRDIRICKCTNVQKDFTSIQGRYVDKCIDCGLVLNHQGHLRIEAGSCIAAVDVAEDADCIAAEV